MRIRRLPHVVVALAALVAPLAAFAQQGGGGTVTTTPLAAAPVMGMPLLALLAVVLSGVAAYLLRRTAGRAIAVVGFVVALTALAAHATLPIFTIITVQGAQCSMRTTQMFMPTDPNTLVSHCPNPIQIVSIQLSCTDTLGPLPNVLGLCHVGQILGDGGDCTLPTCPT